MNEPDPAVRPMPDLNHDPFDWLERHTGVSRRAFLGAAAATPAALFLAACSRHLERVTRGSSSPGTLAPPPTLAPNDPLLEAQLHAARSLPREIRLRLWRGWRPDRGGEVITVPRGFDFFDGGISHSTVWGYTQDIPMVWFGPGVIPARGRVDRPVTAADVAPTVANLMGFHDFQAPDGELMDEVVDRSAGAPRLVVVLVWDAGGDYVLKLWPRYWPNLRALMAKGTWYRNATVGSGPSSTAPIHATIGTGAFPRRHGVLDNFIRWPDGTLADPWHQGPTGMLLPSLADQYLDAMGSRVRTGGFATLAWHLGMLGRGSRSGPQHVAVLREKGGGEGSEGITWGLSDQTAPYYRFPEYVNDLPPIASYFDVADRADGKRDGKWRGKDIQSMKSGFDTPARIPYQERAIEELIRRERFGHHDAPDLLFLNYKIIDEVGHKFTASSPEEGDCVRIQDANLPVLMRHLDREVGKGKWALLITADHGHSANPSVSGAFRIKVDAVGSRLEEHFDPSPRGGPLVQKVRPGWTFIDRERLAQLELFPEQLGHYLKPLDKAQASIEPVPVDERKDPVLTASFAAALLPQVVPEAR
jgi:arylsulfatase A-like enzyme